MSGQYLFYLHADVALASGVGQALLRDMSSMCLVGVLRARGLRMSTDFAPAIPGGH